SGQHPPGTSPCTSRCDCPDLDAHSFPTRRSSDLNCIIVCSIENFDPMGVHTGDSITVAPAQTLTDKEYQILRDASCAVLREIGVDRKSTRLNSSHVKSSYAVFCLKKKNRRRQSPD